ncbi:hypothetical protein N9W34_00500 [Rickettsiales bacterium]|nr:hypothetical protein [Rickettsiales bacterium]
MKVLLTFIIATLLPISSFACAMQEESQALDFRALQSNMMVAALSCDQQKNYNRFMIKYKNNLITGSEDIKSYFKRKYGFSYERELNRFVTDLANKATQFSMNKNSDTYCQQVSAMFKDLIDMEENMLGGYIEKQHLASLHGVNSCS